MGRLKLSQDEIDKLVVVDRISAEPTVCGAGLNDVAFQNWVNGRQIWQYKLWHGMLVRCFCEKFKGRRPTYKDVLLCEEWLSFANFLEWCNKEVGYKGRQGGMELDKDLIIKGNKVYSSAACSFVPEVVNNLLVSCNSARGEWPVGVRLHKRSGKFDARMSCGNGNPKYLGLFLTPEDAFAAYKIAKEAQIKVVALQYKDVLKPAVFESLMNWEILSDD